MPLSAGLRHRALVVAIKIAIERRVARHERALEGRDRLDDVAERHRRRVAGKRGAKPFAIVCRDSEPGHDLGLAALEAELDRMLVEHRHGHLRLERAERGVGPSERGVVGDVGERHRAARVQRAGRADRPRTPVGEGARLLMTRRARERAVAREPRVVEEMAAKFDPGHRHRVVSRHFRDGQSRWQAPGKGNHRW